MTASQDLPKRPAAGAPATDRPAEGVDGTRVAYSERIHPPWWAWLLVAGAVVFFSAAYLVALGGWAGLAMATFTAAVGIFLVIRAAAIVRVDDRVLRVGRARLPLCFIGDVRTLDADTTTAALRTRADANAYLMVRRGYASTSVAVAVTDPLDPHPYWLISTRHPDDLAAAIKGAVSRAD